MARIETYDLDSSISSNDIVLGTDGDNSNRTKNFSVQALKDFVINGLSPSEGGTLKITEVIGDTGENTPQGIINSLDPAYTVAPYEIVIVTCDNDEKYLFTKNNDTFGIDEMQTVLNDFISFPSYSSSGNNIGTGAQVYKDSTESGNNFQLNFRKIKTSNSGTGEEILKAQVENTNDISIIAKTLTSSSLNITNSLDGNEVSIEIPTVSDIPALIVNSAYTGDEELGTAAKPFKTIQGALDAYKGTGGRGTILDPSAPELLGSIIEIEKGGGVYNFTGDLNYKDLVISLKEGCIISSDPISSWLMDFNTFSTTTPHNPIINIGENANLYIAKNGFKLVGGDFPLNSSISKTLRISGGTTGVNLNGTLESHILFEVDDSNTQYVNGGYVNLILNATATTNRGRMFVLKGSGYVLCNSNLLYFLNDANTALITNTYSPIELRNVSRIVFDNSKIQINKTPTVTYNQLFLVYDTAFVEGLNSYFTGTTQYFSVNNSVANTPTIRLDFCKMYINTMTSFANNISGIWNIQLTNNNLTSSSINKLTTSISASAINTIGGQVVTAVLEYPNKAAAVTAGLFNGSLFINKKDVTAGAVVVGEEYKILTIGSTDFTLMGASANTIGLYFTAYVVGTGTGTVSLIKLDIIL